MGNLSVRAAVLPRTAPAVVAPRADAVIDPLAPNSTETAAPSPITPTTPATPSTTTATGDPAPVTGPDGRVYQPGTDPTTGHAQYTHHSKTTAADGTTSKLDIVIDIAPDGAFTRSTHQHLTDTAGNFREQTELASYDAAGAHLSDDLTSEVHVDAKVQKEHTISTYTDGNETLRKSDISQTEHTGSPEGETADATVTLSATWDANGAPITDATKPQIHRTDAAVYHQPGQGINKDTARTLTTEYQSSGTPDALTPDGDMKLTVHFDGHGKQYLERVMTVPLDATGKPDFVNAKVVSTDDHQSLVVKGLTQARVWGGFASSLLGIVGARLIGVSGGGAGKVLLGAGLAAGGASLLGETHALATRRNDASIESEIMSVYNNLTMVAYYAYIRSKGGFAAAGSKGASDASVGSAVNNVTLGLGVNAALNGGALVSNLTGPDALGQASRFGGALTTLGLPTTQKNSLTTDPLLTSLNSVLAAG